MFGGYRNPRAQWWRFLPLVFLLLSGSSLRHGGGLAVVVRTGVLVALGAGIALAARRRAGRVRATPPNAPFGATAPREIIDVRPAESRVAPAAGSGWYPDPRDATIERYWDGSNWTGLRPRTGPVTSH